MRALHMQSRHEAGLATSMPSHLGHIMQMSALGHCLPKAHSCQSTALTWAAAGFSLGSGCSGRERGVHGGALGAGPCGSGLCRRPVERHAHAELPHDAAAPGDDAAGHQAAGAAATRSIARLAVHLQTACWSRLDPGSMHCSAPYMPCAHARHSRLIWQSLCLEPSSQAVHLAQETISKLESEVASLSAQLANPPAAQQPEHEASGSAAASYPAGGYGSRPMVSLPVQGSCASLCRPMKGLAEASLAAALLSCW